MQSIPLAVLKLAPAINTIAATIYCMQSIPLAVLKLVPLKRTLPINLLHAIHTACGIETIRRKRHILSHEHCMQSIPLAVLKRKKPVGATGKAKLHAIHTACGIETRGVCPRRIHNDVSLHAIHTACGIETIRLQSKRVRPSHCMQSIPLAVLKKDRLCRIPKRMKISPAAEPRGLFCRYMYAVFLAVYASF